MMIKLCPLGSIGYCVAEAIRVSTEKEQTVELEFNGTFTKIEPNTHISALEYIGDLIWVKMELNRLKK